MQNKSCESCKFSSAFEEQSALLKCRMNPPRIIESQFQEMNGEGLPLPDALFCSTHFPLVSFDELCGCWEPKQIFCAKSLEWGSV